MPSSRHILIAVAALLALLAAACGTDSDAPAADTADDAEAEPAPAGEAATIRYFTFSAAPDHLETLDAMIAAFNEQHPDITVEVETAPFDDYFTLLQTQLAGGDAPDAFEVNYENFVSLASRGALADLSKAVELLHVLDDPIAQGRVHGCFLSTRWSSFRSMRSSCWCSARNSDSRAAAF